MTNCIVEECGRGAVARGLCRNHYGQAQALIYNRKTTWQQLEAMGKCAPRKKGVTPEEWPTLPSSLDQEPIDDVEAELARQKRETARALAEKLD